MSGNSSKIAIIVALFGGQNALARALGRRQSTVWEWVRKNEVPSGRIKEIINAAAKLTPPVHLLPNDFFESAPPIGLGEAA